MFSSSTIYCGYDTVFFWFSVTNFKVFKWITFRTIFAFLLLCFFFDRIKKGPIFLKKSLIIEKSEKSRNIFEMCFLPAQFDIWFRSYSNCFTLSSFCWFNTSWVGPISILLMPIYLVLLVFIDSTRFLYSVENPTFLETTHFPSQKRAQLINRPTKTPLSVLLEWFPDNSRFLCR